METFKKAQSHAHHNMEFMEARHFFLRLNPIVVPGRKKDRRYTIPPSMNARIHWRVRHRINDLWKEATFWACKEARIPKLKKARIQFTHCTVSPRDRDNLYASVKAILDAIVDARIIPDDKDEFLDLSCRSLKVPHREDERILIEIIELL